ncbi:hypothetical protein SH2C18_42060 [Clostridium sediminicola]|uniref:hypothetical protein n=1 Tax=Clostridium sediminicola TaxID=3114879 RepID=UPI0031F23AA1
MKKLLIMALAISISSTMSFSVKADEVKTKRTVSNNRVEEKQEENKLFIGLIKGYENGKVRVKALFDVDSGLESEDTIYINVDNAEFPNGEVNEYPEGYLITINYDEIKQASNGHEIIAKVVRAVEEDQEVTIAESPEINLISANPSQIKEKRIKPELINEEVMHYDEEANEIIDDNTVAEGFFRRIILLFKQIFS